jgi:hypothetical protein
VVGKPNVGKSTLFNHLSFYSDIQSKLEAESLVHPQPGLTRDCRELTVKGVLQVPISFKDTPGIDFFFDRVKIKGLQLETFGNLFSYNLLDEVGKDTIWEFATFLQQGKLKDKKKEFSMWQREFLKLLRQNQSQNIKKFGVLEHLLSPEKSIPEFLYPLVFSKADAGYEGSLSPFALGKIIELASDSIEKADLIFFMVDSKKDISVWDRHMADWIKFLLARQELVNHFDSESIQQGYAF